MTDIEGRTPVDEVFQVDLEPVGRRVDVPSGTDLLTAAQHAGVDLVAVCGGVGICGTCLVRLVSGELTALSQTEKSVLLEDQIAQGYRLACQAVPLNDVRIDIPAGSLPVAQRLQVEGREVEISIDPAVIPVDIAVDAPNLDDLRSDFSRARDALEASGHAAPLETDISQVVQLSERLRDGGWKVRLAVHRDGSHENLAGVLFEGVDLLGLAVDIGTTKLAMYLVDLGTGVTIAQAGAMNPQISYGEDVVSRIAFANKSAENGKLLQIRLVNAINQMAEEQCERIGVSREQIVDAVMVGNTVMHHFFCGLPVRQLGASPYVPALSDPIDIRSVDVGLDIASGARVYLPANIAGYVGGDHTAALLSSGVYKNPGTLAVVDIGTNTEISLLRDGQVFTCSTASGPAFEGAHIRDGMRAAPGAIERLQITKAGIQVSTIGNAPAVGICGTGILKAVSEMLEAGLLDQRGTLNKADERVRVFERRTEFVLVPAANSGHGRDIIVTRKDVNEIQLAKAAIRSGIDIMLEEAGIEVEDVQQWVIAGAFGTYLDLESAIRIGMFPLVPLERFWQVGNAAGMGAKQMLLSRQKRQEAAQLVGRVNYVELTTYPGFTEKFLERMYL